VPLVPGGGQREPGGLGGGGPAAGPVLVVRADGALPPARRQVGRVRGRGGHALAGARLVGLQGHRGQPAGRLHQRRQAAGTHIPQIRPPRQLLTTGLRTLLSFTHRLLYTRQTFELKL
jgi:hypothetical protein